MPKIRTPWGKKAMHTMIEKELTVNDVANALNMTRQYVGSIIYGRVESPIARKKISDFLHISDADSDE